ncbi:MAG: RES domain-containing protein [Sphingobacteriales bacterium]|nr:MAG: RES domain-containing protein [Sphingobacteriales bacterium]
MTTPADPEYFGILAELQDAIGASTKGLGMAKVALKLLKEKVDNINLKLSARYDRIISTSSIEVEDASVQLEGEWFRSVPLKFLRTPLGTDGSRLHPGRYHQQTSGGAIYFTDSAVNATAERQLKLNPEIFVTLPAKIKLTKVLDLTNPKVVESLVLDEHILRMEWRFMLDIVEATPLTHVIGDCARKHLYEAIKFNSVRTDGSFNIVIFPDALNVHSCIEVFDKDNAMNDIGAKPEDMKMQGIMP